MLGGNTKYKEDIISDKKFNAEYKETRQLLEHQPESRALVVLQLPCHCLRLIEILEVAGWFTNRKYANIRKIVQLNSLLGNTGTYFHLVQAQLFDSKELLQVKIREG